MATSYQQSRAEIEARGQDRPGRDRSDVDVQQARSPIPSTACGPSGPTPTTRSAGRSARRSGATRRTAPRDRPARRTARRRPGPAPVAIQAQNRTTWRMTTANSDRARRISGASGQLRRHQVPVAEDHRREHAAGRGADDDQLGQQRHRAERASAPGQGAEQERRAAERPARRARRRAPPGAPTRRATRPGQRRPGRTRRARSPAGRPSRDRRSPASCRATPAGRRPRPTPAARTRSRRPS